MIGAEESLHTKVKGHALHANAYGAGEAAISADKLRVGGSAGASAYLIAGEVHIETPERTFEMFGEQVKGEFHFGVDAGAFAEANGAVNVDVGWKGAGLHADISGFVGAKAGATAAGTLKWARKSPAHYAETILKSGQWKSMFAGVLPAWVMSSVPDKRVKDWVEKLVELMTSGGEGDALVLGASARAEGSVGIGGAAAFSAGMRGGVLHCHGRGGLTFGVGAGANVDLALGMTDGLGMLGVMALHGAQDLHHMLQPSMQVQQYLRTQIQKLIHA
jgi:hypothetical protein